jgi:hypothetical protein
VNVINTAGRDDENGPTTTCTYTQLNPGSFLIDFTCTIRLTDCGNAGGRSYLSLKWSDSLTYDPQWIATRRRTGTLILSPRRTTDPDSYRPVVTPDVPSGFRRESAEYTLSEDGRIVRFGFVDKEMMTPPPLPAVRMKGVQVEAAAPPGTISQGQIRLRLDGLKGTNKRDLLNAAVFAATDRVHAAGFYKTPGGRIFKGWSVSEGLGDDECWVEVAVNWRIKPEPGRVTNAGATKSFTPGAVVGLLPGFGLLPAVGGLFGGTAAPPVANAKGKNLAGLSTGVPWVGKALPNSDPDRAVSPPTYGTADALRLAAAALNDPCGQDAELAGGGFDGQTRNLYTAPFPFPGGLGGGVPSGANQAPGVADSGAGAFSVQVVPADQIPPDDFDAGYRGDGAGVYDEYTLTASYRHDGGSVVLRRTKAGEPGTAVRLRNASAKLVLEWTAVKVGGPPVIPAAEDSPDRNAVYLRGTIAPAQLELAADGVSTRYEVSGIYEYEFLDPSKVTVQAPLPPYLSCDLADDAKRVVGFAADCIAFPNAGLPVVNPFTGEGVQDVACCGEATNELVSAGAPGFNPALSGPVNP